MSKTNIEFINHASVLISCGKINLLSDPWYSGEVFHHGWRLIHELQDSRIIDVLKKTTHIYISHEHPDHFSPPFFLNENIKKILIEKNIEILFQYTQDKRVVGFLKKNGFNIREFNLNEKINLSDEMQVQIIKHDFYDSSLILKTPDLKILNLNDCPMREEKEIKKFQKKHGSFDVLLTQFSYAAWKGGVDNKIYRENAAKEKLESIEKQATLLNCKSVIPFASFIYFSNELNFYMNDSINTPEKIKKKLSNSKFNIVILCPNEIQRMDNLRQNQASLDFWKDEYSNITSNIKSKFGKSISYEDLKFECNDYNNRILKKIKLMNFFQTINIKLYDHDKIYAYSIFEDLIEAKNLNSDISMHSQSLSFMFKNEFGFDTLTVNGCFESSQKGFLKLAKTFGIGSLNTLGVNLNIGLLAKPQIVFLFIDKLKKVLKKLI